MKLCERTIDFVQITNADGTVRLCSWLNDGGIIGQLSNNSLEEIYHSKEAETIRKMHAVGNHSNCNINTCPYVANGTVSEHEVEIDDIPKYPRALYLAYENICNYRCVMCGIPGCLNGIKAAELEEKYNCLCNAVRQSLCAEIKCAQEDIDLTKDCDIFEISHMALKPIIVIYYWHQIGLFGGADYICVCIPDEEAGFQDIRVYPCYWRELKEIFPGMYKDDMPEYEGCEF